MEAGAVVAVGMVLEKKFLTQHPLLGAVVRVAVTPSLHPKWERAMLPHLSQQKWTLRQSAGVVVLVYAAACADVVACAPCAAYAPYRDIEDSAFREMSLDGPSSAASLLSMKHKEKYEIALQQGTTIIKQRKNVPCGMCIGMTG